MTLYCDKLWTNAQIATMSAEGDGLGLLSDGAVGAIDGRIVYVGPAKDAPPTHERVDCKGRLVTPGLIDPHTHLVFAGNRSAEFEQRLNGATYAEIAAAGGGIVSTVSATRRATQDELLTEALPRLDAMLAEGVTTIEIKSGYGLSVADEFKMLRAARSLASARNVRIVTTFLGAHAVPPEYAGDSDAYIDLVCEVMIPEVAALSLADAVDVYCDTVGFTREQSHRVMAAAQAHGLPIKIHAEQLSNQHGAELAAGFKALSADHLEHLDEAGVAAMAASGMVATLLPGAFYFLRDTKLPPVRLLRDAGVPIALATDCNPGTSPLTSPLLAMNMAATLFRLTVEECVLGVTRNAARALGLQAEIGTLELGKQCDLAIWNANRAAELVYPMGFNPLHQRVWRGEIQ